RRARSRKPEAAVASPHRSRRAGARRRGGRAARVRRGTRSASSRTCRGTPGRDPRHKYGFVGKRRVNESELRLGDFQDEHAETVLGWVETAEDALGWAETPFLRVGPDLLAEWHAQP